MTMTATPFRKTCLASTMAVVSALFALPAAANAGDVTVVVKDQKGAPMVDAVVTLVVPGAKSPARPSQPLEMGQKDLMFTPFVLIVPVGAEVRFNNQDRVRHHVFSFSPAKKFELKLFGKDQSHTIKFDKPGVVALGCNIHDGMTAFIKVVDTPYAVRTDALGRAVLHDVPAGRAAVKVWQPYLRGPANEIAFDLTVPRTGAIEHDAFAPIVAPRR